jgi:8-oxo-dGTP pyrophosphatase MutT (NUDIX family)
MELNSEIITTPPRPAATVVMLRDGDDGLQVFLVRRHGLSDVLGGAYVFPGGKVDAAADALLNMDAHLDQPLPLLHRSLNENDIEPLTAASFYVAAMREAFEESGVLFAHGASATHAEHATRLLREGLAFDAMLAQLTLRLNSSSVLPWSRWITPRQPSITNKRFDTRFFVAAVPTGQVSRHDDHEATDSVWLSPRAALTRYWSGHIELAPPQIMSLAQLARHTEVASVLQAARNAPPSLVAPESFDDDGERVICYPGDERHSLRARALLGPTRLVYRNKRFEPLAGFEGLFD